MFSSAFFGHSVTHRHCISLNCFSILHLQAKLHDFAKKIPEVPSQVQRALTLLKVDLQTFTRNVFKKKRVPASHFMVFMISSERRNKKPYALPVWYLPYASETDATIRTWTKRLKEAMVNCGINVVGKLTNIHYSKCMGLLSTSH